MDNLVRNTTNLLAESEKLKVIHLSITRTDSTVPSAIAYLTFLSTPITLRMWEDLPNFAHLLHLFQIPTLQKLRIPAMRCTNFPVPEELYRRGTSIVTHLTFVGCGWVTRALFHVIAWPKDPQVLHFDLDDPKSKEILPSVPISARTSMRSCMIYGRAKGTCKISDFPSMTV